jgi:EAL domain-containing protein (putative c-di-GMP-specific phosphodiesterase class I)/GGDEF domain-containing protein
MSLAPLFQHFSFNLARDDMPEVQGEDASPDALLLRRLIADHALSAVFQPILDYRSHNYLGFEGLIRGPAGTPLATPDALFASAARAGLTLELERACREIVFRSFAALGLPGKLFVNCSPGCLADPRFRNGETMELLHEIGLTASRIIIEVTENQKIEDFAAMRDDLAYYRSVGFKIAIDDLGEGFSNLRMWSEVRPEFVKIDRHFIQGIADDALKFQLVRSIHQIAEACGTCIIAEGIETESDFVTVRDIGIECGQGYFISYPVAGPERIPGPDILQALKGRTIAVFPQAGNGGSGVATAKTLLHYIEPIEPSSSNDQVSRRFEENPDSHVLPVVTRDGIPMGLINRHNLIDRYAKPFRRELYGKKPCTLFMDPAPLVVDHNIPVQDLSMLLSRAAKHTLFDGFIITENGRYAGVGNGQDLMALITEMQISAARYANPLTQLPGNVPINEHTERLLESRAAFTACYFDLDNFKPFNDVYGYRKGDDVIQILGRIISEIADARLDFIGHIGGDDFIVLFQSEDWESRCAQALKLFDDRVTGLIRPEDLARGGFVGEDRKGRTVFNPLPALSIGAVHAAPGCFSSHHEISAAAASAKKMAKKMNGSSLFIERRRPMHGTVSSVAEE